MTTTRSKYVFDLEAIRALPSNARITGRDRKNLTAHAKKAYKAGATVSDLAAETGRSTSFITRLLDEAGVARRKPGGNGRR
jgi:hypothetical protein